MKDLKIYLDKCQKSKFKIIIVMFLLIGETILAFKLPFLMEELMEVLFKINDKNIKTFLTIFLVYLMFAVIQSIVSLFVKLIFKTIGIQIVSSILMDLYKKIYYSKKNTFLSISNSELYQTVNSDVFNLSETGITVAFQIINTSIHIIGLAYYMLLTNHILTIFIIINFTIAMLLQKYMSIALEKKIIKLKKESGEFLHESNSFINNHITYRNIKSNNYFYTRISNRLNNFQLISYRIEKFAAMNNLLNGLTSFINLAIVLIVGSYLIVNGTLSISTIMTFSMFSGTFGSYISTIPSIFKCTKEFKVSLNRVSKIYDINYEEKHTNKCLVQNGIKYIELNKISFSFNNNIIIKDISVKFHKGYIYSIKGKNGAGKTTLINILLGEFPIESGDILINGTKIDTYKNSTLLEQYIAYCPSNNVFFNDTVKNNIILSFEVIDEKLEKITNILNSHNNKSLELDKLYNLGIDNLSDGQKQRIAIARSLYQECEILIFDEIENHLDASTKLNLMSYLNEIKENKIIIIITHDQLVLDNSDVVFQI